MSKKADKGTSDEQQIGGAEALSSDETGLSTEVKLMLGKLSPDEVSYIKVHFLKLSKQGIEGIRVTQDSEGNVCLFFKMAFTGENFSSATRLLVETIRGRIPNVLNSEVNIVINNRGREEVLAVFDEMTGQAPKETFRKLEVRQGKDGSFIFNLVVRLYENTIIGAIRFIRDALRRKIPLLTAKRPEEAGEAARSELFDIPPLPPLPKNVRIAGRLAEAVSAPPPPSVEIGPSPEPLTQPIARKKRGGKGKGTEKPSMIQRPADIPRGRRSPKPASGPSKGGGTEIGKRKKR